MGDSDVSLRHAIPTPALDRLKQIASDLRDGGSSPRASVRDFLRWGNAVRRGSLVVRNLRGDLKRAGLVTVPDFESAFLDSDISFVLHNYEQSEDLSSSPEAEAPISDDSDERALPTTLDDPSYRISKLKAANNVPTSVKPNDPLTMAVTIMLANDYSQLPVMESASRLKGVISWKTIGKRFAVGHDSGDVSAFMDDAVEASSATSLFQIIGQIVKHDYVLVRSRDDRRISGIVTSSDLSLQFHQLTEPFLLLSEIENHIRRLIEPRFSLQELQQAINPNGPDRDVASVASLTFGEYVRLLENRDNWNRLEAPLYRGIFVARLEEIRRIRNDVMHFDPDGISDDDLEALRDFSRLLRELESLNAFG